MASNGVSSGGQAEERPYTLYHNPYSICALMTRYTWAVRGEPRDTAAAMTVEEKEVDIFHEAQLEEDFLCEINAEGQVPVLINKEVLAAPIADSVKITWYFAERYPSLAPPDHKDEITRLMRELHALNYFSLSFRGRPEMGGFLRDTVVRRMEKPGISQRYREALKFKLNLVEKTKVGGLVPATADSMKERARNLLLELEKVLVPDAGPWLYGSSVPNALDAHLVTFIARMRDVGRQDIIPEGISRYGDKAMETAEWRGVMDGRRSTMYPG